MRLGAIMDEVAARLDLIDGLRVSAHPPGAVQTPAVIVSYPESLEFRAAGGGANRLRLPVVVVCGRPTERQSRDNLVKYCDDEGEHSIQQWLERGDYASFDTLFVERIDFDVVRIGGTEYVGALFDLDIVGS